MASGRDVRIVQVADGRANGGDRTVLIAYATVETTDFGIGAEIIELFQAVATAIVAFDLDLDGVTLVKGDSDGIADGMIFTTVEALLAYDAGRMTLENFVNQLQLTQLDDLGTSSVPQSGVTNSTSPTTYYVEGVANLRSCPRRDCTSVTQLSAGTPIVVTGSIDGERTIGQRRLVSRELQRARRIHLQ
jgi:hypothetical protein